MRGVWVVKILSKWTPSVGVFGRICFLKNKFPLKVWVAYNLTLIESLYDIMKPKGRGVRRHIGNTFSIDSYPWVERKFLYCTVTISFKIVISFVIVFFSRIFFFCFFFVFSMKNNFKCFACNNKSRPRSIVLLDFEMGQPPENTNRKNKTGIAFLVIIIF